MRSFLLTLAVVLTTAIAVAPAGASTNRAQCPRSLESSYSKHYKKVTRLHGKRAPGRNILKFGVLFQHHTFDATCGELRRSLGQLKRLEVRQKYLVTRAKNPALPPAAVKSAVATPSGLAACIVNSESGGDPQAHNGQYSGIAQWSGEAWARHGGLKYASSPTGATYQQQLQVLNSGLSKFGCRDWCPYDPC